jgi:transposase
MYLRTHRARVAGGQEVEYLYLAHNVRDAATKKSVPKIVHAFGRSDELDREELARLCRSIARVCGLEVRDPMKEGCKAVSGRALPEGVTQVETRPLGPVWAIEALWERFGIGEELRRIERETKCKVPYERALFAMTANRLCEPASKLGVWDQWLAQVHVPSCAGLKLAQMYEAMDLLHRHMARVEEAVFFKVADLLNVEVDVVFYDTTTCSFTVDEEDDEDGLRHFGHSKEGGWSAQVIVALAVTREGLPVRSWVFPGDTSDVDTVETVKKDLRGWKLGRALFVADSGMNSADNREELARACGTYLLACRAGSVKEVQEDVLGRPGRYKVLADNLHVKEVVVGAGVKRRRYLVCFNPDEATRQAKHREQVLKEIAAKLASHEDDRATSKWAIELLASKRWGRYLRVGRGGTVVVSQDAIRKAERMDGKWILITNDDTLSVEDAATGYKSLLVIERCFRTMKTAQIRMDPVYHWLPRRIEAHVKICALALLLQRVAELAVGQPWPRVADALGHLQATEYRTDSHRFFQRNEVQPEVRRILKKLKITEPNEVLGITPRAEKP